MRIFGIIFPKCLYTIFSNLLITLQPLPVYYFFKNSLRFFARKLIALSTKINAMVLCALKQKHPSMLHPLCSVLRQPEQEAPAYMLSTPSKLL